jgi:hypothetical protein
VTPTNTPTPTPTPTYTPTSTEIPTSTPTNTPTVTPTPTPIISSCLDIATNSSGGLGGWNPTAFDISPNPEVGTTYPVGSFITFQNGEIRTIIQIDDYSPIYVDIFYDSPISSGTLFPITICYPSIPTPTPTSSETPTPTPTNTETPTSTPTPTQTPNCVRQIIVPTLWDGGTSINSNQLKLTQTSETLQIQVNDIITDNIGSTSSVGIVSSDGTYTYVFTGPGGSVAFDCQFPLTFSGNC